MKLSVEVMAEIVDIFRRGIQEMRDMSEDMKSLDLVENDGELHLSSQYLLSKGRK